MVLYMDSEHKSAQLSLRQAEILAQLEKPEIQQSLIDANVSFHPEYGRYMLESTPARPYTGNPKDLLQVQANMAKRRVIAQQHMQSHEVPLTITSFPLLGAPGQFTHPYYPPTGNRSRSFFLPDEIINPHARFPTLTANIRTRRGSKVAINVPMFRDKNTLNPLERDPTIPWDRDLYPEDKGAKEGAALPNHIYMDSMGFGMGCSCLQITFQATDINEARSLYDQLAPLSPIMLALSAAAPAYRGYLSDQDARWNVIAGSVDDRTPVERSVKGASPSDYDSVEGNSSPHIPKSRYDSIDSYLAIDDPELSKHLEYFNDMDLVVNLPVKKRLKEAGFDELLASHFSHLFIRDPIVIFKELLDQDDAVDSDHFENIQSTNWQTMRFKPPPPNSSIGWRVEFRSMEVQITDFENASFAVFVVLLTRVILSYNLNFYMPISKVDLNMQTAHHRNAVLESKFWFRTDIYRDSQQKVSGEHKPVIQQLTVNQIINGFDGFIGLIPLVRKYLSNINVDLDTLCKLERHLELVSKRASGELITAASWMRSFIRTHPAYKFDSVISQEINYDLMSAIADITNGKGWKDGLAKDMLGSFSPIP